jgi:Flp pilus assembly protein TadD
MSRTRVPPRWLPAVVLALAVVCGTGCVRTPPKPAGPARAQALIEAGNARFRDGDYAGAARRYGAAVTAAPDDAAAHYGLGMALSKLGRDEDARAEYARARDLAEQARGPSAGDPVP